MIDRRRIHAVLQDNGDSREPSKKGRKDGGARRDRTEGILLAKPRKPVSIALTQPKNAVFGVSAGGTMNQHTPEKGTVGYG